MSSKVNSQASETVQSSASSGQQSVHDPSSNGTPSNFVNRIALTSSEDTFNNPSHSSLRRSNTELNGQNNKNDNNLPPNALSEEYLSILEQVLYVYYKEKRHETAGIPNPAEDYKNTECDWRMRERLKTVSAALIVCLNIGADPPDIVKTNPCAKLECWIDPYSLPANKALEIIGKNLQQQYETLSIRTRYKQYLDPSIEEMKKLCISQRRHARDERVLFHYNGHGVPKPSASGEIWVFNKNYTQYIPVSVHDLSAWLGSPTIFVYDCSGAGSVLKALEKLVNSRRPLEDDQNWDHGKQNPNESIVINKFASASSNTDVYGSNWKLPPTNNHVLQLAACAAHEVLPMSPDLPADLFTCCLTSPIDIAVRWFVMNSQLPPNVTLAMTQKIPGRLQDRKTPLGELNWIFTAITDTIAWTAFPRKTFKQLFRQDLLVAALFRNFLLAQRIMRKHSLTPMSSPPLPPTHNHHLWDSWDLALDRSLSQLPQLLEAESSGTPYEYQYSSFFSEQLTAFEVWLAQGSPSHKLPEQLPIILQVLLSQVHRLRALILLSRFLDLGPWAVHLALSIGIFPYVLKLLQSPAVELKPVLVFIWARILAVDMSCQADLLKDNEYNYFLSVLTQDAVSIPSNNLSEHKAMSAFILTMFALDFKPGKLACVNSGIIQISLNPLKSPDALLRQWMVLCLGTVWNNFAEGRSAALKQECLPRLVLLLQDPIPEVRTACLYALTNFLPNTKDQSLENEVVTFILMHAIQLVSDGSTLVRRELVILLSQYLALYHQEILLWVAELLYRKYSEHNFQSFYESEKSSLFGSCTYKAYQSFWTTLQILAMDPFPQIESLAKSIVHNILDIIAHSSLGPYILSEFKNNEKDENESIAAPKLSSGTYTLNDGITRSVSSPNPQTQTQASPILQATGSLYNTARQNKKLLINNTKSLKLGNSPVSSPQDAKNTNEFNSFEKLVRDLSALSVDENNTDNNNSDNKNTNGYRFDCQPWTRYSSFFLEWSKEYFIEPQMRPAEADEPGSEEYNRKLWRRNRNEKIIYESQAQRNISPISSDWSKPFRTIQLRNQPKDLILHQFEPHVIVADKQDSIAVWNWDTGQRLSTLPPVPLRKTGQVRVTDMKLLNEDDVALLSTCWSDGVIRMYKDYSENDKMELATAWRATRDGWPHSKGMISEWQQSLGSMIVSGDIKTIRVWDAAREIVSAVIPARSGSRITALTSDQQNPFVFMAGFNDGAIRIYDQRINPRDCMIRVWKEHKSSVLTVKMQRGGQRELISAAAAGDVRLWDSRQDKSLSVLSIDSAGLNAMTVHDQSPYYAVSSTNNLIKIFSIYDRQILATLQGTMTQSFLYASKQIASVSSIKFHPHYAMLVVAFSGENQVVFRSMSNSRIST